MNKNFLVIIVILSILYACSQKVEKIQYPESKRIDHINEYFGVQVADPYHWLENDRLGKSAK